MGKRGGLWVNEMDLPSSIIFHLMIESGGLKFPWSLHIIFFSHQREDTFDHVFIIGFFSSMTWIKTTWLLGIYNMENEPWQVKINRWFIHTK